MANKLRFKATDGLYVDGNDFYTMDLTTDWSVLELATPLSANALGVVHPFVATERFIGLLGSFTIKNITDKTAGVNTLTAFYPIVGYNYDVRAVGAVAVGDLLVPSATGFVKTTTQTEAVGVAMTSAPSGFTFIMRGGNR